MSDHLMTSFCSSMEENSTTDADRYLLFGDAFVLKELETSISHVHHVLMQTRQKFNKVSLSDASLDELILRSRAIETSCDETVGSFSTNQNSTEADISVPVNVIQKFYDQLVLNMTRTNELANRLYTKEFISKQDHDTIIFSSNLYIANKHLLNVIQATDVYNYFLEQLKETRQNHLYQLLSTSGYDISKEHVKLIRIHYIQLTEKLAVDNGLLSELYANEVISSVERQSIQSEPDSYNRRQRLLSLIAMKSIEDYQEFVEALGRTGQWNLVALLNPKSKCLVEDGKSSHTTNCSTKQNLSVSNCNSQPGHGRRPPPPTLPKPRPALSCHIFMTTSDSHSINSAIKPLESSLFQRRHTHIPQNRLQKNPKVEKKGLNTYKLLDRLDICLNSLIYMKVVLRLRELHLILPDNLAQKLKERNTLILALDREERIFVEERQLGVETRKLKCLEKLNQNLETEKRQLEGKYSEQCNECKKLKKRVMKSDGKIRALQMQLEEERRLHLEGSLIKTNELKLLKDELKTLLSDKQEMRNDLNQRNKEIEELKITLNHTRDDNEKMKIDMEVLRRENVQLLNDSKKASNETEEMVKKDESSRLETIKSEDEQRDSLRKTEERIHQLTREIAIKQETINELTAANAGFNEVLTNTLRAELATTKENYEVLMKENQKLVEEIEDRKEECKTVEEKYRKQNDAIDRGHSTLFASQSTVVRVIPGADKGRVYGIAVLGSQLFISRHEETCVEVYDTKYMTTTPRLLKISDQTLIWPRLAACPHYNCLYVFAYALRSTYVLRSPGGDCVMYRVSLSDSSVSRWRDGVDYRLDGSISITRDHNVLVTMSYERPVREYSTSGVLMREIRLDSSIATPNHCIQLSDGNFVISHKGLRSKQHRVCIVDSSGRIIKSYGRSQGSGVHQLQDPSQLSVDKYDHVFVADSNNHRVQLLSPTLTLLGTVQIPGHRLNNPVALHFDQINHRLYVNSGSDVLVVELN